MVPARSHKVSRVSWYSVSRSFDLVFTYGPFTLFGLTSQTVLLTISILNAVRTPECTHSGLGSSAFARRYLRNHFCFLFLRLLRCFSSPGSPRIPMYSVYADAGLLHRVSPFRYLLIITYLQLPVAFRSLSRLSSALSA